MCVGPETLSCLSQNFRSIWACTSMPIWFNPYYYYLFKLLLFCDPSQHFPLSLPPNTALSMFEKFSTRIFHILFVDRLFHVFRNENSLFHFKVLVTSVGAEQKTCRTIWSTPAAQFYNKSNRLSELTWCRKRSEWFNLVIQREDSIPKFAIENRKAHSSCLEHCAARKNRWEDDW